ncbi:hypothetical protein Phum_PHUM242860 [Pediculus humanus corporis]|uniref:GRAM domain-containing protein n=1 Tax=Pediculus humanus subsp. corporis TaxID=121224 RepID=E0VJC6_PEDHC|nr:uncharacterized protein Phum_PHUM242860 [Pediculus humanus corporis]EEB13482.1 hypothetical protein Phum_PHUM242860 [Pediculus humanus corporis]
MTQAYSVSRGPADPDESAGAPFPTKNLENAEVVHSSYSSKARQKKFHRHFKQVNIEEKVLKYYSCALVGDILLQGHLYITENFFAFYSNVFGYVTKLLIPAADVLKISKEKTAKIIPNAVGISTEDEKHVFGSLLSRDSTYKFMVQVWKAAINSNSVQVSKPEPSDDDSTVSSGNEEEPSSFISNLTPGASSDNKKNLLDETFDESGQNSQKFTTILVLVIALLAFLFASAGYLLYRIVLIQNNFKDFSSSTKR